VLARELINRWLGHDGWNFGINLATLAGERVVGVV
jgi:hypothetical protein